MQKITFEDLPSTNTPLNANNLNTLQDNVEDAIDGLISNNYGTSNSNGYTQNYINNNVGVVESGSNANGNYIKFADGTMICYAILPFNLAITSQYEGIYYANTGSIIFPQEFISTPVINIMLRGIAGGGYSFYNVLTSEFSGFVWKIQSKTSEFSLLYQAIGRWK